MHYVFSLHHHLRVQDLGANGNGDAFGNAAQENDWGWAEDDKDFKQDEKKVKLDFKPEVLSRPPVRASIACLLPFSKVKLVSAAKLWLLGSRAHTLQHLLQHTTTSFMQLLPCCRQEQLSQKGDGILMSPAAPKASKRRTRAPCQLGIQRADGSPCSMQVTTCMLNKQDLCIDIMHDCFLCSLHGLGVVRPACSTGVPKCVS